MDSPTPSQNIETRDPCFLQVTTPEVPTSGVIIEITRGLQSQEVIQAAWIEGTFGHPIHDRWPDINLHLLVSPNNDTSPEEFALELLPLPLSYLHIYPIIPHSVYQLVADNGIRLDIIVHRPDTLTRPPKECCALYDPLGRLTPSSTTTEQASAEQIATSLKENINEFSRLTWRCQRGFSSLTKVITEVRFRDGFEVNSDNHIAA